MTFYTLQLVRFIAALLVLFFHLGIVDSGYKGVDIFFVISGFVIYYTLFCKKRPTALKFFVHRGTKIFFLYWVALVLLYIVRPFPLGSSFIKTFLLIPGHYSVLGVSWSLSYELYFYFLLGFIVYGAGKKHYRFSFLLLFFSSTLITLINLTIFTLKGSVINFLSGPNLWEFLLGVLSGFISLTYSKLLKPLPGMTAAVLLGLLFFIISVPYNASISYVVYGSISFAIVLSLSAFEEKFPVNDSIAKLYGILGDSSYAIYLFGPIVTITVANDDFFDKTIIVVLTIAFSILFNQVVEKRFLSWSRGKLNKSKFK